MARDLIMAIELASRIFGTERPNIISYHRNQQDKYSHITMFLPFW